MTVNGIGNPTVWQGDVTNGNFDTAIHWSNQGPTPYQIYDGNLDASLTAPVGKPAASDIGRWNNAADPGGARPVRGQQRPVGPEGGDHKLENIMTTQVPVAPLLYGAAWWRVLHPGLHRLAVVEQPVS